MIYFCPVHDKYFEYCSSSSMRVGADKTIIDQWNTVPVPPPPQLKSVTVNPKSTALLVLDMETSICKSPRYIVSIPNISNLLNKTRKNKMLVVYSLIPTGNPSDIFRQLAPLRGEPVVKSSNPNKS